MPPTVVTVPEVPSRWKCGARPAWAAMQREVEEEFGDLLDHALEDLRRDVDAAVALGQGHDADGQRLPGADALARVGEQRRRRPVEPGDLRRAAADVEHDHRLRPGDRRATRSR